MDRVSAAFKAYDEYVQMVKEEVKRREDYEIAAACIAGIAFGIRSVLTDEEYEAFVLRVGQHNFNRDYKGGIS